MTALNVLFLTLYPEAVPSSRLRVYQYLPLLAEFGINGTAIPVIPEPWFSHFRDSSSKWSRLIQHSMEFFGTFRRAFKSRNYDVIVIQKGVTLANFRGLERLFTGADRRLIFDLDDAVYGNNAMEFGWPFLRKLQDPEQTAKLSKACRAVIAGNQYLKNLALKYNPNVYVVSTPVNTQRICPDPEMKKKSGKEIIVGWLGMPTGIKYLSVITEVLRKLSQKYPLRLRLISLLCDGYKIPGVDVEIVPWVLENENRDMNQFDIAVSPLFDDSWEKGKCSLKLLQYMAAGLPTVSSRVGMNSEVIEDGVNGFLASTEAEWVEKISRLIENENLRRIMGKSAREKVVQDFSLQKAASSLAGILRKVGSS